MRKSLRDLAILGAVALLIVTLTGGCKGKAETKPESVPFSQQTSHPGLENASSVPGRALAKAETVECQNNLQQLRASIRMDVDQGQQPPSSIGQGPMASVSKCPITGKIYEYDSQTGKVWCTTSGHEKF
ncbi:MAG: hypothetical protein ACYC63_16320 [Armatimonadota bacterium]